MKVLKKAALHTLGCKLNYAETSTISRMLSKSGYEIVGFHNKPDVFIINTCSVTEKADKECKTIVKKALQYSPDAYVIIIGCYAQLKPKEIAEIEGVDLILGTAEKFNLIEYLQNLNKKEATRIFSCDIKEADSFIDSFSFGQRTRGFLKVQDGCDYNCSFCTIPLARGKSRSDDINNVVKNANYLASRGVKEIVLTGINIGDFGKNKSQATFLELIKTLDNVEGIERFRISSIEPNLLSNEIIGFVAASKRFMPHFHVPLQSGSNKILKLMQRRYLRELYQDRVSMIKQLIPHCCIGVDVIVGSPSETEEDFQETYNFLKELDIAYLHVFTYSERPGTPALNIKDSVPVHERKKRNKMLRILSEKKRSYFYQQNIGQNRKVLIESKNNNGFMYGFTDNYIKVEVPFTAGFINKIIEIKLNGINSNGNMAALLEKVLIIN